MSDNNETGPGLEPIYTPESATTPVTEPVRVELYHPPPGVKVGNYAQHPAYRPVGERVKELRLRLTPGPISDMIVKCHMAAWNAGWWHDIRTGKPLDRNAGEMLMLQVSELCEAAEGLDYNLADDKLPHRKMVEVEIADFLIRQYDYCGGLGIDLQAAVDRSERFEGHNEAIHRNAHTPALFQIVRHLSDAMEGHRKKIEQAHTASLARAWRMANYYARMMGFDLVGAINEKMAYNRTRADHQPAARLAEGGKQY